MPPEYGMYRCKHSNDLGEIVRPNRWELRDLCGSTVEIPVGAEWRKVILLAVSELRESLTGQWQDCVVTVQYNHVTTTIPLASIAAVRWDWTR